MSNYVFHFLRSLEGDATTQESFALPDGSTRVIINNDHATDPMRVKFDEANRKMTIRAGEKWTFNVESNSVTVKGLGSSVPYRLWIFS